MEVEEAAERYSFRLIQSEGRSKVGLVILIWHWINICVTKDLSREK